MSEFLDELARSVARPMSRSRALRVLGGALVSLAVPGFATTKARAASSFHTCERDGGTLCKCNCKGEVCQTICCTPKEEYKCRKCGTVEEGAGCEFICPASRKCGSKCCGVGSECADPDLEYCCEARERACKGGGSVDCCSSNEYCCQGKCCPPKTRCVPAAKGRRSTCGPCPPKSRTCGKTCCIKGESCCGGKCCPKSQKCCPSDICCDKKKTCCGETCCTDKQTCCDDHCCNKPKTCCGDGCCNEGRTCYKVGGKFSCCPDERLAQTPAGKVCCPPLYYAEKDRCCPTGRACTECDPPCPRGQYCQDGVCLQGG